MVLKTSSAAFQYLSYINIMLQIKQICSFDSISLCFVIVVVQEFFNNCGFYLLKRCLFGDWRKVRVNPA